MKKSNWRLIRSGPGNAAWNMAVDEAINRNCLEGLSPPTLRFYSWEQRAITIGRFQKQPFSPRGSTFSEPGFIRRITGGRAVRHGQDLTFSISVGTLPANRLSPATPQHDISTRPREGFLTVARLIKTAFEHLGIELGWGSENLPPSLGDSGNQADCFSGVEAFELGFKGDKLLGCAQKRMKNGLLQQGTLRIGPLKKHLGLDPFRSLERKLPREIQRAFEEGLGLEFSPQELTPTEWNLALKLEKLRYRNPDWNTHGKPLKI